MMNPLEIDYLLQRFDFLQSYLLHNSKSIDLVYQMFDFTYMNLSFSFHSF